MIPSSLYGCACQYVSFSTLLNHQTQVTCIQTWYYYVTYPLDPWYIKLLVAGAFVSDSCHQALITHAGKCNHKPPVTVYSHTLSLHIEVLFNGITALLVQSFLAMRVYRLSGKNWPTTGSVMILVIGEFGELHAPKFNLQLQTFPQLDSLKALSMSVNAVAVAGDVLIAASLCILLQRSRTGFRRSDSLINKLMLFSINTGLLTSICAIASLVSIIAWPDTFIYIAFYFCLGRLYCNSLLATLNARKLLRAGSRDEDMSLSFKFKGVQPRTNPSMIGMAPRRRPTNVSIKIDTAQEYLRDEVSQQGHVHLCAVTDVMGSSTQSLRQIVTRRIPRLFELDPWLTDPTRMAN
ncbi:hypothetical protein HD554DRAFT_2028738 [Boletus coccyginus]|nr:hypothetical protein HD554DRAFT_2028738 [Boletus coccyginus]